MSQLVVALSISVKEKQAGVPADHHIVIFLLCAQKLMGHLGWFVYFQINGFFFLVISSVQCQEHNIEPIKYKSDGILEDFPFLLIVQCILCNRHFSYGVSFLKLLSISGLSSLSFPLCNLCFYLLTQCFMLSVSVFLRYPCPSELPWYFWCHIA